MSSIFFLLLLLVFLILVIASMLVFNIEKKRESSVFSGLNMALFLVMMPRAQQKKEGNLDIDEKKLISQMEQVLSNFLYLKKPNFFEREFSISLEIASQIGGSDISFYMAVPTYLSSVFEKYIQGVYPNAVVDKIDQDYTIFEPEGKTAGAYLTFSGNNLFSISTYNQLEKDPLALITNTLSKISSQEGAAIQIVIKPLEKFNLRKAGEEALKNMREGKSAREAVAKISSDIVGELLYEIFKPHSKNQQDSKPQEKVQQGIDQKGYDSIQNKIQKQAFEANVRIISSATTEAKAEDILNHLLSAFSQFSLSALNDFKPKHVFKKELKDLVYDFSFRNFSDKQSLVLNLEELASLYHFPTHLTETPYIKSTKSAESAPPVDLPQDGVNLLGKVKFRQEEKEVYFASEEDRRRHFYLIGQTGTGKSTLLRQMIKQDISNGKGVALIDPHGDLVEQVLSDIPKHRAEDVVLFEPFDTERPCGLNMLEYETQEQKDFAVQEMISIFYKLFPPEIIGPMFEHYMRNAMLALMADKNNQGTLVEIPKMFTDQHFLEEKIKNVSDPIVRNFWLREWAQTTGATRSDMLGYVVSKLGRFIENEMMRNIIGQPTSGFNLAEIMNGGKIFLANLSKGLTGEVNSSLLGLILVSKMQMAAMSRARIPEQERKDFYLYIDEFQNFTTDSIATILSEARKYRLNLIIAHQYMPQLKQEIRDAVLGNVGTMGAFRIGAEDAENLEKQFLPEFSRFDLVNLDNLNLILKIMIQGKISSPFKMQLMPFLKGKKEIIDPIKKISKLKYGKQKSLVEQEISKRLFVS